MSVDEYQPQDDDDAVNALYDYGSLLSSAMVILSSWPSALRGERSFINRRTDGSYELTLNPKKLPYKTPKVVVSHVTTTTNDTIPHSSKLN